MVEMTMQNPFGHRPQNDFGRDESEGRREEQGRRAGEGASWSEGDGGRTAEAFRNQGPDRSQAGSSGMGYGGDQQSRYGEGMATGWTGKRSGSQDRWQGGHDQNERSMPGQGGRPDYGRSQQHGSAAGGYGPGYSQGGQFGGSSMGGSDYRPSHGGNQAPQGQGHSQHGYAPGGQIWEGSGRGMGGQTHEHHDFEPDYLHWRQEQLSAFDKDYSEWRNERRQRFSSDFDSWRQTRPRSEGSGEHKTPAENPIVGDVSDGGTGNAAELKKR